MIVKVTAAHLAFTPRTPYIEHDLFTRALGRKGLGGVRVILIGGREVEIPKKALGLRHAWEQGVDIEPFEFEIKA